MTTETAICSFGFYPSCCKKHTDVQHLFFAPASSISLAQYRMVKEIEQG
jgi:hypothetical protein